MTRAEFMSQLAGGQRGVARALGVVAGRDRHRVHAIGQRLHHQRAAGTNHVKILKPQTFYSFVKEFVKNRKEETATQVLQKNKI